MTDQCPIIWNKSNQRILTQIDYILLYSPSIPQISLSKHLFQQLYESIPERKRAQYADAIPYRGKMIIRRNI